MTPSQQARVAGICYLLTFVTGMIALRMSGWTVANLVADVCYVGVTVLFYRIFAPVNRRLSLVAALFSAAGCLVGLLAFLGIKVPLTPLPLFGVYCLLIGYLIIRSTFLPRILGVLLMIGGVSWLTFAYVPFARMLAPYNYVPGIVAEGLLTLWLLVMALDTRRWWEQSALAQSRR